MFATAGLTPVTVPKTHVEHVKPIVTRKLVFPTPKAPALKWDYRTFLQQVNSGDVERARIRSDQTHVHVITYAGDEYSIDLPDGYDEISFLMNAGVDVDIERLAPMPPILGVAALLVQLAIARIAFSKITGRGKQFSAGDDIEHDKVETRFTDVAGAHSAKRDLAEIVDFLQNPESYEAVGAKIPRGVLLTGQSGTGKTLLARSVAGEAGVPFFACSASEFMQIFVGVGASKVRTLFESAAKVSPSIVFIDEIDSIGRSRSSGIQNNDEREQTLNQLLVCMDGFAGNYGVVVIAATNRPDILDDALMRPGRFDRIIEVPLPDANDRLEILKVHCRDKVNASDVDLVYLAKCTPGFSGAALFNLTNEAALMAARKKQTSILMVDWISALDKVTMGEENVTQASTDDKVVYAYHEAGHALMSILSTDFDNIRKVSIVSRGHSGGVTVFEPSDNRQNIMTREYLENQIRVGLAGRVAEDIVFGKNKATTGAQSDFQKVTDIAYDMIVHYGFGNIGAGYWAADQLDDMGTTVSEEVKHTIGFCYDQTWSALKTYEPYLHKFAAALLVNGTLNLPDIREIMKGIACPMS